MKIIKIIIKFIGTLPQITILLLRGIPIRNFEEYKKYVTLFRYLPFAHVHKNNIVSFYFKNKKIRMYYGNNHPAIFVDVFGLRDYENFLTADIRGKDVIDIGAASGDTAIYFWLKGARKVYGYEIIPRLFSLCQKNIELNNLSDICSMELSGIGTKNDFIDSSHPVIKNFMSQKDKEDINNLRGIKMKTVFDIVQEHKIQNGILKIDTEGFEYEIIESTDDKTLRCFSQIVIEFHYGVKNLEKKLQECGFVTYVTKSAKVYIAGHNEGYKNMEVGYLSAKKI